MRNYRKTIVFPGKKKKKEKIVSSNSRKDSTICVKEDISIETDYGCLELPNRIYEIVFVAVGITAYIKGTVKIVHEIVYVAISITANIKGTVKIDHEIVFIGDLYHGQY